MQASSECAHVFTPRARKAERETSFQLVENDRAIQHYFDCIRSKQKNRGTDGEGNKNVAWLSPETRIKALSSMINVMQYLGIELKEGAVFEMIEETMRSPAFKRELERKLQSYALLMPAPKHVGEITYFKGIYHKNSDLRLRVDVDNHFNADDEAIDPLTLNEIWDSLTHEESVVVALMAYTGERDPTNCTCIG